MRVDFRLHSVLQTHDKAFIGIGLESHRRRIDVRGILYGAIASFIGFGNHQSRLCERGLVGVKQGSELEHAKAHWKYFAIW